MKRKGIRLLPLAVLCLFVRAEGAASATLPVKVPVSEDAQVRVALSNTNPNMIVVPGDRITGIDSAQGMFLNDNRGQSGRANGGVVLMTAQTEPFTFFIRTEGGLVVSLIGVPQKRDGRVLHLVSDKPIRHQKAVHWEQSHPYVTTLTAIHKAALAGLVPDGFKAAPATALPAFSLPGGMAVQSKKMWNGGNLRLFRLDIRNNTAFSLAIPERLFQASGVRSVMVFPYSATLMPSATAQVWITVSNREEGKHGQY
ncbi:type-F conjugative transfer system secretin TraK [Entomohabitans teleogrylli]|uniref:type-F conjugative transfer system secretin TraK n=1 Tax=Entomohabitans teleogrylli TaxID=1384589 RepID=UPI00073D2277|nr:type-F conjugative transfer system secretin TraK [Entomohabitans teleogrylli]